MNLIKGIQEKISRRSYRKDKSKSKLIQLIEFDQSGRLKKLIEQRKLDFKQSYPWEAHVVQNEEVYPIHVAATRPSSQLGDFIDWDILKSKKASLEEHVTSCSSKKVLKVFLEYGCDVDMTTASRLTALHFVACHKGSSDENVDLLIDYGIDLNAQDAHNRTALHWACDQKNHKFVKKLLCFSSVRVDLKDLSGLSPLDIAKKTGCAQNVDILLPYYSGQSQSMLQMPQQVLPVQQPIVDQEDFDSLVLENQRLKQSLHSIQNVLMVSNNNGPVEHSQGGTNDGEGYMSIGAVPKRSTNVLRTASFGVHDIKPKRAPRAPYSLYCNSAINWTSSAGDLRQRRWNSFSTINTPQMSTLDMRQGSNETSGVGMDTDQWANQVSPGRQSQDFQFTIPAKDQPLSREKKNSVQQNISNFLEHMRPEVVSMHLFEKGIINDATFQKIHSMDTDRDKNFHIIFEVVFKRSNKECDEFVSILETNGMQFLAALLSTEFADAKLPQEV